MLLPHALLGRRQQEPGQIVEGGGAVRLNGKRRFIGLHCLPVLPQLMVNHGQVPVHGRVVRRLLQLAGQRLFHEPIGHVLLGIAEIEEPSESKNAHQVKGEANAHKAIVAFEQARFRARPLQTIHTLPNAEMMPAGQVPDLPACKGDPLQGSNHRLRPSHGLCGEQVGLTFEVPHEKTHDETEIHQHGQQNRNRQTQIKELHASGTPAFQGLHEHGSGCQEIVQHIKEP